MIATQDWAVLLRVPRLTSVLDGLLLIVVASALCLGIICLLNVISAKKLARAAIFWTVGAPAAVVLLLVLAAGFQSRYQQAKCWRAGPTAFASASDQIWCRDLPARDAPGRYYLQTLWGRS